MNNKKLFIGIILISTLLFGCQNTPSKSPSTFIPVTPATLSSMDKTFFTRIGNPHDSIFYPTIINGKAVVVASDNKKDSEEKDYFLIYGDKEFGPYDYIDGQTKFGDGIVFHAQKKGFFGYKDYIVTDQYEILSPYEISGDITEVNGKITFNSEKSIKWDSEEGTGEWKSRMGTVLFKIIHDFEEIGTEYDTALNLQSIGGKLYYQAEKDGKEMIIVDGKPMQSDFERIWGITEINKNLAYAGVKNEGEFVVINQKTIGPFSKVLAGPYEKNGKIIFITEENNKEQYIYYSDDKKGPYENISTYQYTTNYPSLRSHVLYTFTQNKKTFVFIDGKEFGPFPFEDIPIDPLQFQEDNGNIYFVTLKKSGVFSLNSGLDGKEIENSDSAGIPGLPEIINGKILSEKYQNDYAGIGAEVDYYFDGINITQKYKNKYSSILPENLNGTLVFIAYKESEQDQFYIIMDDKEYGPFPKNSGFSRLSKNLYFTVINDSKKEELYISEIK